ncbi:7-deoxyloganetin glucosyltransferase-like [Canna indica]|uniref:7-deoxyloganetin glucosyltransferase-like n=1 Tax=Canna indica TaxID=4628 RepID=A0AAQ3KJ96_9LILI|nr:7-deoxyloganetin glucosyltransferase-like [Canna indica]
MEMPHAVLIPYPTAGQLNPMLQLAQLLQSKGFFVTFVNTESSHRQLRRTAGLDALRGTETLRFVTVADGVSEPDLHGPDHLIELWLAIEQNCPAALAELLMELNSSSSAPRITCVVTNYLMTFAHDVAARLGVPELVFWTTSACGLMASLQLRELIRRGYVPLPGASTTLLLLHRIEPFSL